MTISDFIDPIIANHSWIFSGIGVTVLVGIIAVLGWLIKTSFKPFYKEKASLPNKVNQKNIIAGGDVVGGNKSSK